MKTTLVHYTVREITDGFVYNAFEGKGLFGLGGRLVIQPEYQRNYIYTTGGRDAEVVKSLLAGYPLGLIYFARVGSDRYEVLDGQQRITSFGRFVRGQFAVKDAAGMPQYFSALPPEAQKRITDADILVYECEGTETEIKAWFQTINIAGVPLNTQELLNAVYSGPFVTAGRKEFSNSQNANVQRWCLYIAGAVNRQDIWETALDWVSKGNILDYMAAHRHDTDIREVKTYFGAVLDWVGSVFTMVEKEMKGLDWGRLYEAYHDRPYDPAVVAAKVQTLYADPFVKSRKGVFEFILGGETEPSLLDIRLFDEPTKRVVYEEQTTRAKAAGVSNCPHCAIGTNANRTKIWAIKEMDADHVSARSRGGATTKDNCEMLCASHNRAKGNR